MSGLSVPLSQWLFAPISPLKADEQENTMTIIELALLLNALSGLISAIMQIMVTLRRSS